LKLETNISYEIQDIVQPTYLGDVLNNGNQPGKAINGLGLTANLTFGVRVWKCFCQSNCDSRAEITRI
jgi:hypothetical protein